MRDKTIVGALLLTASAYAIVRYNLFKGVPFEHLPLYIGNKILAFAGLAFVLLASLFRLNGRRSQFGNLGLALLGLHTLASLVLLRPAYFAKFYTSDGKMTWQAEGSMLASAIAMVVLVRLWQTNGKPTAAQESLIPGQGRLVLVCTAAHVGLMGYAGWLHPTTWPGFLPPITLLAFLGCVATWIVRMKRSFENGT